MILWFPEWALRVAYITVHKQLVRNMHPGLQHWFWSQVCCSMIVRVWEHGMMEWIQECLEDRARDGATETSKAPPGSLTAKAWVQAALLSRVWDWKALSSLCPDTFSLSSWGTGAFSGCPRASRLFCLKGRAGLDCVKNKMNQRWAKLSGGMIELRFYKTFQKDLFISFLELW